MYFLKIFLKYKNKQNNLYIIQVEKEYSKFYPYAKTKKIHPHVKKKDLKQWDLNLDVKFQKNFWKI